MKRIPIGIDNFKKIMEEDFYYVDKTKYIDELIYDGSQVKLFTRLRRFGKTLNMSMLKYFFDIRDNEENRKLFNGDDVEEAISGTSDLSILMDSEEVWELLLFSGYLTVKEKIDSDIYSLRLPNKEIKNLFKKEFINTHFGISLFRKTMEALKNLKFNDFEKHFQEIMLKSTSNWDTSKEAFYHGLSLGMLSYLDNDYYVTSNFESGFGRYDIRAKK